MKTRDKKFFVISVLGSSTGEMSQSFKYIILPDEVWIKESARRPVQRWQAIEELFESDKNGRHYTVDKASGKIKFGNGERGRIPPSGSAVIAVYRKKAAAPGIIEGKKIVLRGIGSKPNREYYVETETHQTSSGYKFTLNFDRKQEGKTQREESPDWKPEMRRNDYFFGKLLSASDFKEEQQYFAGKHKQINQAIRDYRRESCLLSILLQTMRCLNWKMKGKISISVTSNKVTVRRESARSARAYPSKK
jgi:hypothetical protein